MRWITWSVSIRTVISTCSRLSWRSTGGVVAQRSVSTERARLRGGDALRRASRSGSARLGGRRRRPLRRRFRSLPEPPRREVHEVSALPWRAAAARQGRPARRDPRGALGAREHRTCSAAVWGAAGGSAPALARSTQRRRRAPGRARPAPQRDCDRARAASRRAAAAAAGRAAPALQPLPPLELTDTGPARDDPRAALTRPTHPGSDRARPTSSNARSSPTSAHSSPSSSTSPASARSSRRN